MPRRKGNGSRGSSPDKPLSGRNVEGSHPSVQHKMNDSQDRSAFAHHGISASHVRHFDQNDDTCVALQEMFKGKVDPDVVFLVLSECEWKGEKAYETLQSMLQEVSYDNSETQGITPATSTLPAHSNQFGNPMMSEQYTSTNNRSSGQRPQLQLKSRLPSVSAEGGVEGSSLPLLSPRTPMIVDPNFYPLQQNGSNSDIQSAMTALDMYGQNLYTEDPNAAYTDLKYQSSYHRSEQNPDTQYSQYLMPGRNGNQFGQPSFDQQSIGNQQGMSTVRRPSPQASPLQYQVGPVNVPPPAAPHHFTAQQTAPSRGSEQAQLEKKHKLQNLNSEQAVSSPTTKRTSLRKHTVSLDPAERESLEKLIDEVLQQGFSEDFVDSDSSSEVDTDEEPAVSDSMMEALTDKEKIEKNKIGKDKKTTKQQSTMKVAAKHMKNIPPRFLRKLQAIQTSVKTEDGGDIDVEGAKILLKRDVGEDQDKNDKVIAKVTEISKITEATMRNINGTAQTLPTVTERGHIHSDMASPPAPPPQTVNYVPSPIIQPPVPLSCEDLERKLLSTAPNKSMQRKPESSGEETSKDAPISPRQLVEPSVSPHESAEHQGADDRKTGFSVNAPEFVPKSQRTVAIDPNVCTTVTAVNPATVTSQPFSLLAGVHTGGGRFSPQTTRLQTSKTPDRNTPSPGPQFIVPKVPPPASIATASPVPMIPPYQAPPAYALHPYVHPHHAAAYSSAVYRNPFLASHHYQQEHKAQANLVAHYQGAHMYMPQKMPGVKMGAHAPLYPGMRPPGPHVHMGGLRMPSSPQMSARQDLHNQAQKLRQKVLELIKAGKKVMIIMRGLPGSGKSTLARELKLNGPILSTDDFFNNNGKYEYNYAKIGEAHEQNQLKAKQAVKDGKNTIIIDNTNTQAWEMKFYVNLAKENDYEVEIVEPDTPWKFKPRELARKNTHGVSMEGLQRMLDRYERQVTVDRILKTTEKEREEAIQWQKMNLAGEGEKKDEKRRGRRRRKRQRRKKTKDKEGLTPLKTSEKVESSDNKDTAESSSESEAEAESTPQLAGRDSEVNNNKEKERNIQSPMPSEDSVRSGSVESSSKDTNELDTTPDNDHRELCDTVFSSDDLVDTPVNIPLDMQPLGDTLETKIVTDVGQSEEIKEAGSGDANPVDKRDASPQPEFNLGSENEIPCDDDASHEEPAQEIFPEELKAEIESIIKDRIVEHLLNEEVAKITGEYNMKEKKINLSKKVDKVLGQLNMTQEETDSLVMSASEAAMQVIYKKSPTAVKDTNNESLSREMSGASISPEKEQSYWNNTENDGEGAYTITVAPEFEKVEAGWSDEATTWDTTDATRPQRQRPARVRGKRESSESNSTSADQVASEDAGVEEVQAESPVEAGKSNILVQETTNAGSPSKNNKVVSKSKKSFKETKPALEADLKEQLMNSDWNISTFPTGEEQLDPTSSADTKAQTVSVMDHGTCTDPKDFAALQRLEYGESAENIPTNFLCVLLGSPRFISGAISEAAIPEEAQSSNVPTKLYLDRSCMTDDVESDFGVGVNLLQNCFPSISGSDLKEVLEQCGGDVQWAVNILLDSGYEYNEQKPVKMVNKEVDKQNQNNKSDSNFTPVKVTNELKHSPKAKTPPPLTDLTLQCIPNQDYLLSSDVQENVAKVGMKRLQSIDEFHHNHEHTVPSDGGVDFFLPQASPAQVGQSNAALDVFDDLGATYVSDDEFAADAVGAAPGGVNQENDMVLTLTPQLARQLENLFGPALPAQDAATNVGSAEYLRVHLNMKTARQLHHQWSMCLRERLHWQQVEQNRQLTEDEALARKLQAEEEMGHNMSPYRKSKSEANFSSSSPKKVSNRSRSASPQKKVRDPCVVQFEFVKKPPPVPTPPHADSLHDIMAEETAMEESRKEYIQSQKAKEGALSTLLKQQKLKEMFPGVDHTVLMEIFEDHNYELGPTIATLSGSYGDPTSAVTVMTPEARAAYDDHLLKKAIDESLKDDEADQADFQTLEDPAYRDFRAEAEHHRQLRHECFQKAQDAYRRNMKPVASFYAQQGHLHTQKLKEANRRAAEKIIEHRVTDLHENNQLDLHNLHVEEAILMLERVLAERQAELQQKPDKRKNSLLVVTGRGSHSVGGVARIRPAVIEFLKKLNYRFVEPNEGTVKVYMKQ